MWREKLLGRIGRSIKCRRRPHFKIKINSTGIKWNLCGLTINIFEQRFLLQKEDDGDVIPQASRSAQKSPKKVLRWKRVQANCGRAMMVGGFGTSWGGDVAAKDATENQNRRRATTKLWPPNKN